MAKPVDLPESLKRLVEAWRREGADRAEIVSRLDQLELLAQEERVGLLKFADEPPLAPELT